MDEPGNFYEGDYVQVTEPPMAWEGAGESEEDLRAYVGHVGVVVEVDEVDEWKFALVRFPFWSLAEIGQRNIEWSKLKLVSHPAFSLPEVCAFTESDSYN
jgi:hypothetical protein